MRKGFEPHALAAVLILGVLASLAPAMAEDLVPDTQPQEKKVREGWDFLLTPSAVVSFTDNRSMFGQPEGLTATLGANLESGVDYREGRHETRNHLTINEAYSRTPVLEEFIKSTDSLKLDSIYLLRLLEWLGPYAQLILGTSLFESYDVRPVHVNYLITQADGTVVSDPGMRLRLTDGFAPLSLKETVGFFAQPYAAPDKSVSVEFRLGFGGLHLFADDQLAVSDDGATPDIEVITLKSFSQGGAEAGLTVWGEMYEKRLTYKLAATAMLPVLYSLEDGDDRGAFELTNVDISGTVSFKVLEWLSIDYVLKVLRQPQLLDDWQVQNALLLTASYSFFKPEKDKKE